jgi:hypothetical protein
MRFLIPALSSAVLLAVAPVHAERVAYRDLPVVELGKMPAADSVPLEIGPREKVDGVYPTLPPPQQHNYGIKGMRYLNVFSNEKAAKEFALNGWSGNLQQVEAQPGKAPPPSPCFTIAEQYHLQGDERDWPMQFEEAPSMQGVEKNSPAAQQYVGYPNAVGVRAVRMEQLVLEESGKASLATTEVWVDPATAGVRLIGRQTIALVPVARGPAGVRVFAARDKEGGAIHYVLHVPRNNDPSTMHFGRSHVVMRPMGSGSSDCGHSRVTLRAAPGSGDQATVQMELLLPPTDEEKAQLAAAEAAAQSPNPILGVLGTSDSMPPIKEIRTRSLLVHLGASRSATDEALVPTVSFGWNGRERRMQIF